jgi:hypothetical protein
MAHIENPGQRQFDALSILPGLDRDLLRSVPAVQREPPGLAPLAAECAAA